MQKVTSTKVGYDVLKWWAMYNWFALCECEHWALVILNVVWPPTHWVNQIHCVQPCSYLKPRHPMLHYMWHFTFSTSSIKFFQDPHLRSTCKHKGGQYPHHILFCYVLLWYTLHFLHHFSPAFCFFFLFTNFKFYSFWERKILITTDETQNFNEVSKCWIGCNW